MNTIPEQVLLHVRCAGALSSACDLLVKGSVEGTCVPTATQPGFGRPFGRDLLASYLKDSLVKCLAIGHEPGGFCLGFVTLLTTLTQRPDLMELMPQTSSDRWVAHLC